METNKSVPYQLPEEIRQQYSEQIELYQFRQEQRKHIEQYLLNLEQEEKKQQEIRKVEIQKEAEKKEETKVDQKGDIKPSEQKSDTKVDREGKKEKEKKEPVERTTKLDKVAKLKNKIKDNDGPYKKKVQDAIIKEIRETQLSKFVPEVAQSVLDSGLNKVSFYVEICVTMHSTYPDFIDTLIVQVKKHIELLDKKEGNYENDLDRSNKRRNLARLLGELYCAGVLENQGDIFVDLILQLVLPPNGKNSIEFFITNLKYFAYELFRTNTHQQRLHIIQYPDLAQIFVQVIPVNRALSHKFRGQLREFFKQGYISILTQLMTTVYDQIKEITAQSLREDQKMKDVKDQFLKLKEGYRSILDYLGDYDPTKLGVEPQSEMEKIFDLTRMDLEVFDQQMEGDPFDNDEEKSLYVQIPDLRDLVPKEILKRDKEALTKALIGVKDEAQVTEAFFKRLRECISVQIADELAVEFCYINTKKNRKLLIEEICLYRNNYLLLASNQCRLVATLSRQFKELHEECTKYVIEQYKAIKNQETYAQDKRQRFVRYICELTKFRVMRSDVIMDVFKSFLEDLINQNVEYTVLLIESCGKFLLRSKDSHRLFKFQLDQLSKLRGSKPLSQQLDIQLENALLSLTNNSSAYLRPIKNPSQLQLYIKFLLFDFLNAENIDVVTSEILKLPHSTAECQRLLYKYLIKLSMKGRYSQMDRAAALIKKLRLYYPQLVSRITDHVLEEIQLGLEDNQFTQRQRRITLTKFLGEFYNFQIIEHDIIYNVLYLLIEFGHDYDIQRHIQDLIDPPDDTFRVTQAITLLICVKDYFLKKLTNSFMRYLAFFQRYTLSKQYIPQDVEFSLLDLYESIDINLRNVKSYQKAEAYCKHLLELESTNTQINYQEELKKQFGVAPSQDSTLDLLVNRRKEEEIKEAERQRKLEFELEAQFNVLVKEGNKEALQKPAQSQTKKPVVVKAVIKGNTDKKVIVRGSDQSQNNKKVQKRNQNQDLTQFLNFNAG